MASPIPGNRAITSSPGFAISNPVQAPVVITSPACRPRPRLAAWRTSQGSSRAGLPKECAPLARATRDPMRNSTSCLRKSILCQSLVPLPTTSASLFWKSASFHSPEDFLPVGEARVAKLDRHQHFAHGGHDRARRNRAACAAAGPSRAGTPLPLPRPACACARRRRSQGCAAGSRAGSARRSARPCRSARRLSTPPRARPARAPRTPGTARCRRPLRCAARRRRSPPACASDAPSPAGGPPWRRHRRRACAWHGPAPCSQCLSSCLPDPRFDGFQAGEPGTQDAPQRDEVAPRRFARIARGSGPAGCRAAR